MSGWSKNLKKKKYPALDAVSMIIYDNTVNTDTISTQLRKRRLDAGLSVSQLARRAGTSAPTISRYETGWTRFELYTLGKLASALGCRVHVTLEPIFDGTSRHVKSDRTALVRRIRRLFWDRSLRDSDLDEYRPWVVKRVLEYGTLEDVRALANALGHEALLECAANIRFGSKKAAALWRQLADMEGIECTIERFQEAAIHSSLD